MDISINEDVVLKMAKSIIYGNPKQYQMNYKFGNGSPILSVSLIGVDPDWYDHGNVRLPNPVRLVLLVRIVYDRPSGGWGEMRSVKSTDEFFHQEAPIMIDYDEYLSQVRDSTLSKMNLSISDKIKNKLDEYIEFDIADMFMSCDTARIFGGSIRDIISDMPINDIDIVCAPRSAEILHKLLISKGYFFMESLVPKDLSSVYSDIKIISEPHSYVKGSKIVQVIRPRPLTFNPTPGMVGYNPLDNPYEETINDLINNVDISCCGVSFSSNVLYEDYPNAILHARNKVFSVNSCAKMYSKNRIDHRRQKLTDRGWVEIENTKINNRDLKIGNLLELD
jgi:hypothetical protein